MNNFIKDLKNVSIISGALVSLLYWIYIFYKIIIQGKFIAIEPIKPVLYIEFAISIILSLLFIININKMIKGLEIEKDKIELKELTSLTSHE